jgi:ABC-2 type transport system ATP-binding protein
VRTLDQAGITVDDVEVHQPSLDDVFFALTGHATSEPEVLDDNAPLVSTTEVAR